MRWEMRTRLFLRTAEFLWQEGHTAHATEAEAEEETHKMLEVYRKFAEEWMAMPVLTGVKSEGQKFPGAVYTLCIEAMMQDRKALQAGTSHFLGQNFAKAFNVQFQSKEGKLEYAWATSWGVSTRLIGGLIMTHSDDQGLVVPPRLAPIHVVICPIGKNPEEQKATSEVADKLAADCVAMGLDNHATTNIRIFCKPCSVDDIEVPLRIILSTRANFLSSHVNPLLLFLPILNFGALYAFARKLKSNPFVCAKFMHLHRELRKLIRLLFHFFHYAFDGVFNLSNCAKGH